MTDEETETQVPETNEPIESTTEQVETFDREYVEKLRKENATYRTKAKKAEEAAEAAKTAAEREKLDEVERLKAEKADADKRLAEIEARAVAAERRAALTGKVADPAAALKLLDDAHLDDDGNVNVTALLEAYPFLAPKEPGVNIPGARSARQSSLTHEDIARMTPEQINERWTEIQAFKQNNPR